MLYLNKSTASVKIKVFLKRRLFDSTYFLQTRRNGYVFYSLPLLFRGVGNWGSQLDFGSGPCRSDRAFITQLNCLFWKDLNSVTVSLSPWEHHCFKTWKSELMVRGAPWLPFKTAWGACYPALRFTWLPDTIWVEVFHHLSTWMWLLL